MTAAEIIRELKLSPLEMEGGSFHELYRSEYGTSIYYLLQHGERSRWHRVESDEIWYYHAGIPAWQLIVSPEGIMTEVVIGPDIVSGERPQSLIPGGSWQTAVLLPGGLRKWGLFGAAVFPAFEYHDFTVATDDEMIDAYPELKSRIQDFLLKTGSDYE